MYLGISIMIKVKVRDAKLKPKLMRQQWRVAVVLGFLEIDDTSCSQAECVIAPQRHDAIVANSHIEDMFT